MAKKAKKRYTNRKPGNKFSVYLDDRTLAELDSAVADTGRTRSKLVALCVASQIGAIAAREKAAFAAAGIQP